MTSPLPSGFYDLLVTERTLKALQAQAAGTSQTRALDAADSVRLAEALHRQLASVLQEVSLRTSVAAQLALVNGLLADLRRRLAPDFPGPARALELVSDPPSVLTSVLHHGVHPEAPHTGLHAPWLFTAGKGTPSLLSELRRELGAVGQVDILVSFITVSGVRKLRDVLAHITAVGADGKPPVRLRVLTTTYIGATDAAAVHELASLPGCEVRVSLDGRHTRLHAKAWIFRRATGLGPARRGAN